MFIVKALIGRLKLLKIFSNADHMKKIFVPFLLILRYSRHHTHVCTFTKKMIRFMKKSWNSKNIEIQKSSKEFEELIFLTSLIFK